MLPDFQKKQLEGSKTAGQQKSERGVASG